MDPTADTGMLAHDDVLVDLVAFKWLMAGVGWWVNLSRIRSDARYASECARRGLSADSSLLQQRSRELLALLPA